MRLESPPRWRRLLKDVVASAISRAQPLAASLTPALGRARALVVGYHRVVEDFDEAAASGMPTMLVSRAMFERHMDWIGRHFEFVSLDDIGRQMESGEPFEKPVAAITFDDGYRDVYEQAAPVLVRKGVPAAMFLVTNHVGQPGGQVHDRLYSLLVKAHARWRDRTAGLATILRDADVPPAVVLAMRGVSDNAYLAASTLLPAIPQATTELVIDMLEAGLGQRKHQTPPMLTWPMIETLRKTGFTIGSHTQTHTWLANESDEKCLDELVGAKQFLEARLGEPVEHFAYPGGQFTTRVVDLVARAGYRFAYTACEHDDPVRPLLTIQRLLLWERSSVGFDGNFSSAILDCQTHGLWPPANRCDRHHAA